MTQTPATKDVLSVLGLSCGGAASAVPIVFADGQDPIKRGLVVRLARPAWKADTSCLVAPQVPGYMVRNKYTSANINLAERHRAASPRSFIMKKRSTLAAGCGLFVSLIFVGAAQAQSAQDFVNKVAMSGHV
jgi:hypothetical protein